MQHEIDIHICAFTLNIFRSTVCPEAAKSNFGDICFLDKLN